MYTCITLGFYISYMYILLVFFYMPKGNIDEVGMVIITNSTSGTKILEYIPLTM